MSTHLAIDFGAESAKVFLGTFDGKSLKTEEIHRFKTGILTLSGRSYWNIYRFFEEILFALKKAADQVGMPINSIGIDTWGVDFVIIKKGETIPGLPFSYRDRRTEGIVEKVAGEFDLQEIYNLSGVQILPFNSFFQLMAAKNEGYGVQDTGDQLLFIPDIFNYLLTGKMVTEFTFATTSQLFNPVKRNWEPALFEMLGINTGMMQQILNPCTVIGKLRSELTGHPMLKDTAVVAPATHDTASAIAAIPAEGSNWAYISTGTWALVGIESAKPVINELTWRYNITNEGGMEGYRLLKNMMGLWLVQGCRKAWGEEEFSYELLMQLAAEAQPFRFSIDPDDPSFFNPENMPGAIEEYCRRTKQQIPTSKGEIIRGILESLALKTRLILEQISEATSVKTEKIYLTGGGVHNTLLCQFIANATNLQVIATWADSTAIGNLLGQLIGCQQLKNLEEGRGILKQNIDPKIYNPENQADWDVAYDVFLGMISRRIHGK